MMKLLFGLTLATAVSIGSTANAQTVNRSGIGVGAQTAVGGSGLGVSRAALEYDTGPFYIDGLLGLVSQEDQLTVLNIGGRFFYILHAVEAADFAVGGGLALNFADPDRGDSELDFFLEAGAKVRAFIVDNVALSATLGFAADLDDPSTIVIGSRLVGAAGLTYFFY